MTRQLHKETLFQHRAIFRSQWYTTRQQHRRLRITLAMTSYVTDRMTSDTIFFSLPYFFLSYDVFLPSFLPFFQTHFLPSFLPSSPPSFIPSFLSPKYLSFLSSFLHSKLPSFFPPYLFPSLLPSFLPTILPSFRVSLVHPRLSISSI